ncbi:ribbon-helix-helix domain-containing protein [Leucothrix pacifica]|uniref:Addiction module antitoxin n=1 Tax=Leucothrix pacifica TaxID=1247513 RepID=A0A317C0E4_9GAMM|nr:addiction module antitoxin [Leucothrix pacifica]PWQ92134.1 addiction module antitoxin [Leucothrix pacifica]
MPNTMSLNVRVTGSLCDFVAKNISDSGQYDNVSEYIRDLIRQDKQRAEQRKFERVKAELQLAFAAPESEYAPLTADDIFKRNDHLRKS